MERLGPRNRPSNLEVLTQRESAEQDKCPLRASSVLFGTERVGGRAGVHGAAHRAEAAAETEARRSRVDPLRLSPARPLRAGRGAGADVPRHHHAGTSCAVTHSHAHLRH
eukprot:2785067-Rhodomonas_salina.2